MENRLRDGGAVSEARDILLFSYGTLQFENVQIATFGRVLGGEDDAMPGYRKDMVEITDPAVVATSGERFHPIVSESTNLADEVAGRVFAITEAELAAADAYEVSDYRRVLVGLKSGRSAWAYIKA